jgi:hypothetical protein
MTLVRENRNEEESSGETPSSESGEEVRKK